MVESLTEALATNSTLQILDIENNFITGIGVVLLAKVIETNTTLRELRINNQRSLISTEAEEALMTAVLKNETLVRSAATCAANGKERADLRLGVEMGG